MSASWADQTDVYRSCVRTCEIDGCPLLPIPRPYTDTDTDTSSPEYIDQSLPPPPPPPPTSTPPCSTACATSRRWTRIGLVPWNCTEDCDYICQHASYDFFRREGWISNDTYVVDEPPNPNPNPNPRTLTLTEDLERLVRHHVLTDHDIILFQLPPSSYQIPLRHVTHVSLTHSLSLSLSIYLSIYLYLYLSLSPRHTTGDRSSFTENGCSSDGRVYTK